MYEELTKNVLNFDSKAARRKAKFQRTETGTKAETEWMSWTQALTKEHESVLQARIEGGTLECRVNPGLPLGHSVPYPIHLQVIISTTRSVAVTPNQSSATNTTILHIPAIKTKF